MLVSFLSSSLRREKIKNWVNSSDEFGRMETKWVQVIAHDQFPRVAGKLLLRSLRSQGPQAVACVGAL